MAIYFGMFYEDAVMVLTHGPPLLLALLLGPLIGVLAWGIWRYRRREAGSGPLGGRDDVLFMFMLLAALAIGAFLAYLLILEY
jgi:hypothetical protein